MDRSNIKKIANTPEDQLLLAKVWDKIFTGIRKNIPANTCFLSPRELEMSRFLFGNQDGLITNGGYDDAERKMLIYLPEYMDKCSFYRIDPPFTCVKGTFFREDSLSHRDILGALMGVGISRETIGDICVGSDYFLFFISNEVAPFVVQNMVEARKTKLHLEQVPIDRVQIPQAKTKQIKDTLASLRLDCIISSGFRISRAQAVQYICAGKAAIDGLPCDKPDKIIEEGCKLSVRGLGKIKLTAVNCLTKKGRISVIIDRYM